MPVKRRKEKRREELSDNAKAWLMGEPSGFFGFKDEEYLRELFDFHADKAAVDWPAGAICPRKRFESEEVL